MTVVYAASLGMDEGLADLSIRAWMSLLSLCSEDGCDHWILYASVGLCALQRAAACSPKFQPSPSTRSPHGHRHTQRHAPP